jgi:sodium transport system ATP-binding protein
MNTPVIEVLNLTRCFGSQRAVDAMSFEVLPGEVVGLLGPNGAGKTTALRLISGLLTPETGWAKVAGIDVHQSPLEARKHLGFLTASTGLYERLTGREVLTIFGQLHGLPDEAVAQSIASLAAELDLNSILDKRCGALSSGQKQRISIARALVNNPKACVLDEPTAMLDPLASKDILEMVLRAKASGRGVLFSTHRMEEAEYLCTRLYFVRAGKIVAHGSVPQLLQTSGQSSLTAAFLHFANGVSA